MASNNWQINFNRYLIIFDVYRVVKHRVVIPAKTDNFLLLAILIVRMVYIEYSWILIMNISITDLIIIPTVPITLISYSILNR